MRIALFGGSFDPVHLEHVRLVEAAIAALRLDRVFIMPSRLAPHKPGGAAADGAHRLSMCSIAFRGVPAAVVSDFELTREGTSYTYLTCRRFAELYPDAERFFLLGADMLEDFFYWKNPEEIVSLVTLAACGRGAARTQPLHEAFRARFHKDFLDVPFTGEEVSSTRLRVDLAFGKSPRELSPPLLSYIRKEGLYTHPAIAPALALERETRREHSYRVAKMALERAKSAGIAQEKALLAAALHDCGKYVLQGSPLLKGFIPPAGVPAPVMHQFTGAYLAEHAFGITDSEVLGAIRCHTSGRERMTPLDALIFLSDLLEEERSFEGIEALRTLFWSDLGRALLAALRMQTEYLRTQNKPVYGQTQRALDWAEREFSQKGRLF